MTCIVGYVDDETVYVGSESQASSGDFIKNLSNPKVVKKGGILIGFSGYLRPIQILRQHQFPDIQKFKREEDYIYNFTKFTREVLKEEGFLRKTSDIESLNGTFFLVGIKIKTPKLFVIDSSFQYTESTDKYRAIGSGRSFAVGALHAMKDYNIPSRKKVELSIKAACTHSSSCGGSIHIKSIK